MLKAAEERTNVDVNNEAEEHWQKKVQEANARSERLMRQVPCSWINKYCSDFHGEALRVFRT